MLYSYRVPDQLDEMGPSARARNLRRLRPVIIVLALAILVALWVWYQSAETRAVLGLSASERREIYAKELGNLQALCGEAPRRDALERRCGEQAELIMKFPECGDDCQRLAKIHLPKPSRLLGGD